MKAHRLTYLRRVVCIAGWLSAPVISAAPNTAVWHLDNPSFVVSQLSSTAFDDNLITSKVRAAISADPKTTTLTIDVDTMDGVVVVKGLVPNSDIASHLIQLVASVEGVRFVQSRLRISTTGLVLMELQQDCRTEFNMKAS